MKGRRAKRNTLRIDWKQSERKREEEIERTGTRRKREQVEEDEDAWLLLRMVRVPLVVRAERGPPELPRCSECNEKEEEEEEERGSSTLKNFGTGRYTGEWANFIKLPVLGRLLRATSSSANYTEPSCTRRLVLTIWSRSLDWMEEEGGTASWRKTGREAVCSEEEQAAAAAAAAQAQAREKKQKKQEKKKKKKTKKQERITRAVPRLLGRRYTGS
ncbi:hypothetical protein WH47_06722 [Habropoda laboriosa]|uniref:Uncharacterized protein n=1 Tax=Habropoda laboriosa TaxID=597456 RepID=A0A0L7RI67_9HYME|nr:hypothetical protein WH47_06722 [Habropoda laboriosa]